MLKLFDNVSIGYALSISTVVNGNPEDILFAHAVYDNDKGKHMILLSENCEIAIPTQNNKRYTLTEIAELTLANNNIIENYISIGNENALVIDDNKIITKSDIAPKLVSFTSSATNNICNIGHNYGQCPNVRVYQTDGLGQYTMTYPTIHNYKNYDGSYTLEVIFDDSSSNSYVIAINH